MAFEVYLPKMSDHMETGRIVCWHFTEGDTIERGQILLELETDKAIGEVEAPSSGILQGVQFAQGEEVPVGATIAYILAPGEVLPGRKLPPQTGKDWSPEPLTATSPEELQQRRGDDQGLRATPLARKVARDLGVDLGQVTGTGPRGIILDGDVRQFFSQNHPVPEESLAVRLSIAQAVLPGAPTAPADGMIVELNPLQKAAALRMAESFHNAPHFYLQVTVDMTCVQELIQQVCERILQETGERVSVTGVLVKAAATALKRFPHANAMFENDHLRLFDAVNIGIAVGAEDGLVVPVIKNADIKTLADITRELRSFQAKAKEMRFSPEDLSGGTFTISNLGMYGIDVFQAIINPPQSAILAVGRIIKTPMGMPDDSVALRPMMAMTLSVDHRAMDGLYAAKLLTEIKSLLETPYLMI